MQSMNNVATACTKVGNQHAPESAHVLVNCVLLNEYHIMWSYVDVVDRDSTRSASSSITILGAGLSGRLSA
jgi:hypothetical protein